MMSTPSYTVGDIAYLRESAAIGQLEAVRISGVKSNAGGWVYSIQARAANPVAPSIYGDRVSLVNNQVLYFDEAELISHCEALTIMENAAINNLVRIQAMKQGICDTTDE